MAAKLSIIISKELMTAGKRIRMASFRRPGVHFSFLGKRLDLPQTSGNVIILYYL